MSPGSVSLIEISYLFQQQKHLRAIYQFLIVQYCLMNKQAGKK
jgi:hypothetical protein